TLHMKGAHAALRPTGAPRRRAVAARVLLEVEEERIQRRPPLVVHHGCPLVRCVALDSASRIFRSSTNVASPHVQVRRDACRRRLHHDLWDSARARDPTPRFTALRACAIRSLSLPNKPDRGSYIRCDAAQEKSRPGDCATEGGWTPSSLRQTRRLR